MTRRALIVGIDRYKHLNPLIGCVSDAESMATLLQRHDDRTPNFHVTLQTDKDSQDVTRNLLRLQLGKLFTSAQDDDLLFYFAGHGKQTLWGPHVATYEGRTGGEMGVSMQDIADRANASRARSVTIILDCCFAGAAGDALWPGDLFQTATLRENVVILAAARSDQDVLGTRHGGHFTQLLRDALTGAAGDTIGDVDVASLFTYVSSGLRARNEQDPVLKAHITERKVLRRSRGTVPIEVLRDLPLHFKRPESVIPLSPEMDHPRDGSDYKLTDDHRLYNHLIALRDASLLNVEDGVDLYWALQRSKAVALNVLGQYYWGLAQTGQL